ncbi:MAG: DUF2752 domain-containing protein [Acidobacteria bacterium]|nr:DUF2752 domain-containing protein [Acidobacteriota bacterium]
MALFASGIPRLFIVVTALAAFCLIPPETLTQGPDLCLGRILLDLSACPACGSTRALAAFFHGRFAEAWAFNSNVAMTAPGLLAILILDLRRAWERFGTAPRFIMHSSSNRRAL